MAKSKIVNASIKGFDKEGNANVQVCVNPKLMKMLDEYQMSTINIVHSFLGASIASEGCVPATEHLIRKTMDSMLQSVQDQSIIDELYPKEVQNAAIGIVKAIFSIKD